MFVFWIEICEKRVVEYAYVRLLFLGRGGGGGEGRFVWVILRYICLGNIQRQLSSNRDCIFYTNNSGNNDIPNFPSILWQLKLQRNNHSSFSWSLLWTWSAYYHYSSTLYCWMNFSEAFFQIYWKNISLSFVTHTNWPKQWNV